MYDYQLGKNEEVLLTSDNGFLKKGNDVSEVSIV